MFDHFPPTDPMRDLLHRPGPFESPSHGLGSLPGMSDFKPVGTGLYGTLRPFDGAFEIRDLSQNIRGIVGGIGGM